MPHTNPSAPATFGDADVLLADPAFLLNADPDEVTALFAQARSPRAGAMIRLYRAALHHGPATLPWLLDLHAHRGSTPTATTTVANSAAWLTAWTSNPQFGRPALRHPQGVTAVATAVVDGRPVAVTGSEDRTVRLWDLTTGEQIGEPLTGHTSGIQAVATAVVDGRPVAVTGSDDRAARVWDLATRRQIGEPLTGHASGIRAVATGVVDGRPVAVTCADFSESTRVWDLTTHRQITLPFPRDARTLAAATMVVDGRTVLLTGTWHCMMHVWDLATGKQIGEPPTGHLDSVSAVATAVVDGRPVAVTGSEDRMVRVWSLTTYRRIGKVLSGHLDSVSAVATAVVDGRPVAVTGSADKTVRVWDLTTHQQIGEPLTGHTDKVRSVATALVDGRPVAVTGSEDGTARVWDLGAICADTLAGNGTGAAAPADTVRTPPAAPVVGGRTLLLTGGGRKVRIWDLAADRIAGEDVGPARTGSVWSLAAFVLDGQPLVVTGSGRRCGTWSLATGQFIHNESRAGTVFALDTHIVNGEPVVLAPVGNCLRVINPRTGQARRLTHEARVTAVTSGDLDGQPVAITATIDRTLHIWDLATRKPLAPAQTRAATIGALHLTTLDNRPVLLTALGRWLRLTDPRTGAHITPPLAGHDQSITALTTTTVHNTPVAVTVGQDKTVRVWDLTTHQQIGDPLEGHTDCVQAVVTTAVDGRPAAVTGSDDGTLRVWDLITHRQIGKPLKAHASGVKAVATVMVDGRPTTADGDEDSAARVWNLSAGPDGALLPAGTGAAHTGTVCAAAVSAVGGRTLLLTGGDDHRIRIRDLTTGSSAGRDLETAHSGTVRAIANLALEGQPAFVTGTDRMLKLWKLATGQLIREESTGRDVLALDTHTVNGKPVVLAAVGTCLRVIDAHTGRARRLPHRGTVTAVTTGHLDGRPVAVTATSARTVHIWDLTTKKPLAPPQTRPAPIGALHLATLDGRPVLLTAFGRWLRLTDPRTGAPIGPLFPGHTQPITAVTTMTSSNALVAVTGSADTTLRTWDLTSPTPTLLGPPLPFPHPITTLTPTPEGDLVVTHGPEATRVAPNHP